MKYTLLDLVQTIASSMDSDEVNSVSDSVESQQIAKVIRTVYFDMIGRANLPEHYSLVNLEPSGTSEKPTIMYLPETVADIDWIKYDKATLDFPNPSMEYVRFLPLQEFLERMHSLDIDDTDVSSFAHVIDTNSFTITYRSDKAPDYYTTFDDRTLIFDSFDSTVDTTLQRAKSIARAKNIIPFTLTDTFTPDLDEEQFALLLNEAKALAWAELRQTPHGKAEQNTKRGWTHLQKRKTAVGKTTDFEKLPNFGRR